MSSGEPLDDDDRRPWLEALAGWTGEQRAQGTSTVLACSALKRSYRDVLRRPVPDTYFLHLHGTEELLRERMRHREHFMPPNCCAPSSRPWSPSSRTNAAPPWTSRLPSPNSSNRPSG